MQQQGVAGRVDRLERRVDALEQLPERMDGVESQLLQLREEVREGFSAVRSELRGEMQAQGEHLRSEMRGMRGELRGEIRAVDERLTSEIQAVRVDVQNVGNRLSAEIREGREESTRHMQIVVEHYKEKLLVVDEGHPAAGGAEPQASGLSHPPTAAKRARNRKKL